jgi:hypothetical protein
MTRLTTEMSELGHSRQFERATETSAWGPPSDVLLLRTEPALSADTVEKLDGSAIRIPSVAFLMD